MWILRIVKELGYGFTSEIPRISVKKNILKKDDILKTLFKTFLFHITDP